MIAPKQISGCAKHCVHRPDECCAVEQGASSALACNKHPVSNCTGKGGILSSMLVGQRTG